MTTVAVVAHAKKQLGGGLDELRERLRAAGFPDPLWYEVPKSKKAPACARDAVAKGADLLVVWGGDGTVQRCIDAVAGSGATLAIVPTGTSNLLATALGIPKDLEEAVRIGLHGDRRTIDTGTVNGEHFAMMAGAGWDALLVRDADSGLKDRFGRAAYLYTGATTMGLRPVRATVTVDGRRLYRGPTTCVLVGNTNELIAGIDVFEVSEPDDGVLEVGVVTAQGRLEWLRVLARVVLGKGKDSPFVVTSRGRTISVAFRRATPYELDGGDREPARRLDIAVDPSSVTVCVPVADERPDDRSA